MLPLAPAGLLFGSARAQQGPGMALLLRHAATEPGVGDPPGHRLDVCSSQRQLSVAGRARARGIGPAMAAQGLRPARVLSSRWCRCLDTAREAFGQVEPWPALDSFFDAPARQPTQTRALQAALLALRPGELQVWVTHMVNIAALTGQNLAMGEALLVRAERRADGEVAVQAVRRVATEPVAAGARPASAAR